MVETAVDRDRRQIEAMTTDPRHGASEGGSVLVDLPGEGLEYVPELGFARSVVPRVAADDSLHFPVFDVLPPPTDPVKESILGLVTVPLADARDVVQLLDLLERCPSASRASWRPLGWKTMAREIRAINEVRDYLHVLVGENKRYREVHGKAKCLCGFSEVYFGMAGDRSPCKQCVYAWIKAALCFRARDIMRYHEGLSFTDLDVLLESLTADAILAMLRMIGDDRQPLARLLTDVLSAGASPSAGSAGQQEGKRGKPDLHREMVKAMAAGLWGAEKEQGDGVFGVMSAWARWRRGDLQALCLAIHDVERARRIRLLAEWEPLAVAGMEMRAHLANVGQATKDAAGDRVHGFGWVARRNIIWLHHARQYRRDHPTAKWKSEVVEDVALNARDPATGEVIERPVSRIAAAVRGNRPGPFSTETVLTVFKNAGIGAHNILSAELPPIPPLAEPPPARGTPLWMHDPDDVWLGVLRHITGRW
jgi:hypothetical protein